MYSVCMPTVAYKVQCERMCVKVDTAIYIANKTGLSLPL